MSTVPLLSEVDCKLPPDAGDRWGLLGAQPLGEKMEPEGDHRRSSCRSGMQPRLVGKESTTRQTSDKKNDRHCTRLSLCCVSAEMPCCVLKRAGACGTKFVLSTFVFTECVDVGARTHVNGTSSPFSVQQNTRETPVFENLVSKTR